MSSRDLLMRHHAIFTPSLRTKRQCIDSCPAPAPIIEVTRYIRYLTQGGGPASHVMHLFGRSWRAGTQRYWPVSNSASASLEHRPSRCPCMQRVRQRFVTSHRMAVHQKGPPPYEGTSR